MTASQDKILAIRAAHPEHGKRMSRFDRTIDRIEAREDWRSGYGQKGGLGPNTGKKAVKFLCPHPLGIQRADEVKITNNKFIPEMTALLEDLGKKVIGWEPGGNFSPGTIRQLWMDDNGRTTGGNKIRFIDSRHLYLNHMDPLETVVTIFNRKIGNKEQGDASMLGGTICMWHDRAVAKDECRLPWNACFC